MNIPRILQVEKSMKLHGQLQPVVARVHAEGIQLIDGFKRLHIADDLMMETLQCHLLEIDEKQAKVLLLSYNRPHQSMEAWEEALVLKDLLETHDLDQGRLAKLTGYSRSWVSRRLSLIGKMDEQVASEIRMGTLTSSHARALIRLPRGNQCDVASVITTYGLSSRLSDRLVDAFLEAEDEQQQRYILDHPDKVLENRAPEEKIKYYDSRLSGYGNDLARTMGEVIESMQLLLSRLGDQRFGILNELEKMIITPGFVVITDGAEILTKTLRELQTQK